ncbi:MAG: ABC transporter permease [Cryobacterium sp.]|nr:ABC transporter permease [Cryobacterium sp.]
MDGISSWFGYVVDHAGDIATASLESARMALIVVVLATVFSLVLGVAVERHAMARTVALSVAEIFLTIPSLALFAIFIPVLGIGNPPAILALFLYAILPILRNTLTGLGEVDPAVVEAARGMGMSTSRQLVKVRLPLAWPVIMAGVRVSSLLVIGISAIAVLVGGDGLGSFIQNGLTRLGFPGSIESVFVGTIFLVLLGLILDSAFALVQRLTTSPGLRN